MDYRELYRQGKFAEALTALEQSPEAVKKTYAYFYNRGIIHHALNQDSLAVAYLEKAKVLNPGSKEWEAPLNAARTNLAKFLGASRLDSTSTLIESVGESLPLDAGFIAFGGLSLLFWAGFLVIRKKRDRLLRFAIGTLAVAVLLGGWSIWLDRHPLWIASETRMVKSGPGESYLDRGPIEAGMKLRVEGASDSSEKGTSPSQKWLRVRFNENHDSGYVPERSGLLLIDESNTPES